MPDISERFDAIRSRIDGACRRAGRPPDSVELVAVSKTHPPESILAAVDAGHLLFGESRVQEARAKIPLLPSRARWHFVGHLQSNKVRQALPLFELFHGVDSLRIAAEIDRVAADLGLFPKILLEVNLAGESSKFGFRPEALRSALPDLLALRRIEITGLMTLPPFSEDPEDSRPFFAGLRDFRKDLEMEGALPLPHLSMGMSGDFEVAIEEGATLVRVGTALFGERPKRAFPSGEPG
jgi:hypothetical protein